LPLVALFLLPAFGEKSVYLKFDLWKEGFKPILTFEEKGSWGKFNLRYRPGEGYEVKTNLFSALRFSYSGGEGFELKKDWIKGLSLLLESKAERPRGEKKSSAAGKKERIKPLAAGEELVRTFGGGVREFSLLIEGRLCDAARGRLLAVRDLFGRDILTLSVGGGLELAAEGARRIFEPARRLRLVLVRAEGRIEGFLNGVPFSLPGGSTAAVELRLGKLTGGCFIPEELRLYKRKLSRSEIFILKGLNF